METREELINGLKEAIRLMNKIKNLNGQINSLKPKNILDPKKKPLGLQLLCGAIVFLVITGKAWSSTVSDAFNIADSGTTSSRELIPMISATLFGPIIGIIAGVITVFISGALIKSYRKKHNKEKLNPRTVAYNKEAEIYNKEIEVKSAELKKKLIAVTKEYNEKILPWYPKNYFNIYAAEFFLDAVLNFRADTIKEAINLYETTQHQQRVEENQRIMHKKQDLGNMLAFGNLLTNMQTNQKLDQTNQKLDQANSTLDGIRRNTASRSHTVHHYFHK